MNASEGDVIQLDPDHCRFGPLLCIVSEVKSWGVQCYAVFNKEEAAYFRVNHGNYVVVGRAEWKMATS